MNRLYCHQRTITAYFNKAAATYTMPFCNERIIKPTQMIVKPYGIEFKCLIEPYMSPTSFQETPHDMLNAKETTYILVPVPADSLEPERKKGHDNLAHYP